jgi:hypothetical protein
MSVRTSMKAAAFLAGLGAAGLVGTALTVTPAAHAAPPQKPAISEEASAAVAQMGKSLLADQFSFQARTLRVYGEPGGGNSIQPLHIAHSMKVTVRRPDRLLVALTGDDGATTLTYDGKNVVIFDPENKKYASIPAPATMQGMLETVMGKFGVDFPLADFLTDAPDKSFLSGVTSGREVGTVTIDGVPCRHLLFVQPPGIELELWVEKNDRALARRLIVTYRAIAGQPSFVAELFDWNLSIHPTDAEFVFQPPAGAVKVDLTSANKSAASGQKGAPQ